MARAFGVEIDEISASEIAQKYPGLNVSDAKGGVYLDKDGQADPVNITQALAKGARAMGVKIIEGVAVTDILSDDEQVTGVTTPFGNISADYVVNCGGMWARQIGQMAGVSVPLHACEHFYIVTEQIPDLQKNLPVLRVPDECAYYKEDAGKILLGAFEPVAKPWGGDGISEDFEFTTLPDDFEHFEPILEQAVNRLPVLEQAGIQTFFNGPESFTPDDRYMLGEAPELKRFFVAAGFNSVGIQSAGGAGMALAQWIDRGRPQMDIWDVDIRRVHPFQSNRHYLSERVSETLGLLYADHFPIGNLLLQEASAKHPCITGWLNMAPVLASYMAGSGQTGSCRKKRRHRAKYRNMNIAGSARTGLTMQNRNILACAIMQACLTCRPLAKLSWLAKMPRLCCNVSARIMLLPSQVKSSIRNG